MLCNIDPGLSQDDSGDCPRLQALQSFPALACQSGVGVSEPGQSCHCLWSSLCPCAWDRVCSCLGTKYFCLLDIMSGWLDYLKNTTQNILETFFCLIFLYLCLLLKQISVSTITSIFMAELVCRILLQLKQVSRTEASKWLCEFVATPVCLLW